MAKVYNIISITAFSLAAVSLIMSIIFWFKFKIPKIMRELSGKAVRKSVSGQDERDTVLPSYKPKSVSVRKGAVEKEAEQGADSGKQRRLTEELGFSSSAQIREQSWELAGENGTVRLNDDKAEGTMVLQRGTVVMGSYKPMAEGFEMIQNIVLIHTDEVI